jgi:hypothetical protein
MQKVDIETGEIYDDGLPETGYAEPPGLEPPSDMPTLITNRPEAAAEYGGVSRMITPEDSKPYDTNEMRTGVQDNGTPWASNVPGWEPPPSKPSIMEGMPKLPNQMKAKEERPTIPGPPPGENGFENTTRSKFERYAREQIANTLGDDPVTMSVSQFKDKAWAEANSAAGEARKTNLFVTPNYAGYNQRVNDFIGRKKEGLAQLDYMMQRFDKDHELKTLKEGEVFTDPSGKIITQNPKEVEQKPKTDDQWLEGALTEKLGHPPSDQEFIAEQKKMKEDALKAARSGTGEITDKDIVGPILKVLPKKKTEAEAADRRVIQYENLSKMAEAGSGGLVPGLKGILAPVAEALGMDTKVTSEAQAYQLMARAGVGSMRLMLVGSGQVSNYEQDLMQRLSGGSIKTSREAAKLLFNYYATESRNVIAQYNKTIDDLSGDYPEVKKVYGYVGKKGTSEPAQSDLEFTARKYGITVDEVKRRIAAKRK